MISYNTINVKMPELPHRETTAWVKAVAASYGKRVGELAYVFCDDEKILEVNKQYLQHDYYTDIISFDYTEATSSAATSLSASTRYAPTRSFSRRRMTMNCTAW